MLAWAGQAEAQQAPADTVAAIRARGQLICGVSVNAPGFALPDSRGEFRGLDVDTCRAVAAAILGGPKHAFLRHFMLWLGLMGGALLGAVVHRLIGLSAIWLAAMTAATLTIAATFFLRDG